MKTLFSILLLFTGIASISQTDLDKVLNRYNRGAIPYISVNEARMLQHNEKIILLDAREREEFEVSHLPSARYIGYKEFSENAMSALIPDKKLPIIVYCSIGIRSEKIAAKLKKMGCENVRNLYGGIFEWSNNDLPLIDMQGDTTKLVHI
jgi:rhodanese-related sulfurtransferase